MKILVISHNQFEKYNWGHELFRREMSANNDTIYFGPGYVGKISLKDFLKQKNLSIYDFDFVFTHGLKYTRQIQDIYTIPPGVTKVHYVIDYFLPKGTFKGRSVEQHKFLNLYKPDIIFTVYHDSVKELRKNVVCDNIFCLPFSVCTKTYVRNNSIQKQNLVSTCFSRRLDVYPDRIKVIKCLDDNKIKTIDRKVRFKYIKAINISKIVLGVNDIYNSLNMRVTEILSCGGFLLTNRPKYIEKLGLIDGKHYRVYTTFDEMIDMIKFYQIHDKYRTKIEIEGMNVVRKYHSCNTRIKEMVKIINKVKK